MGSKEVTKEVFNVILFPKQVMRKLQTSSQICLEHQKSLECLKYCEQKPKKKRQRWVLKR